MSKEETKPDAAEYSLFQDEIFLMGVVKSIQPAIEKDPNELEAQAKKVMRATSYAYVAGGAGERATMDANRMAFRRWKLIPRMLQPTVNGGLRVNIFGRTYNTPIFCAPVGVQDIFHEDGELGMAQIAADLGLPFITSTASSSSLEDIAKANRGGDRWYQLYWPQSKPLTESLLSRAETTGHSVLVVTLDTSSLAWRPWDLNRAYTPFAKGTGNAVGFSDPVFRDHFKDISGGGQVEDNILAASQTWLGLVVGGKAHSWDELSHLREHWKGPIMLKGVQHPEDAMKALELGMDGVIVSNHGGRQLDGAIGSLEMLPQVVNAVKGKKSQSGLDFTVMFDSGIRTGVDIIKALCLGASGVLIGRPWVYGLGINGKEGAREVLRSLLADLSLSMALGGIPSVKDCTPDRLSKTENGGERASNN